MARTRSSPWQIALALVFAVFTGTIYHEPPYGQPTVARATPTLSGAIAVDLSNPDFSGTGPGEVGTPSTNFDFETAGGVPEHLRSMR